VGALQNPALKDLRDRLGIALIEQQVLNLLALLVQKLQDTLLLRGFQGSSLQQARR